MFVLPPHDCYLSAIGEDVYKGTAVEVPDDVGDDLVAQGWHVSKAKHDDQADEAAPEKGK